MKTMKLLTQMVAIMLLLSLVACSSKDESIETPKNEPSPQDNTQGTIVGTAGRTVTEGDFTIQFPNGTFTEDTKVVVTEVSSGKALGSGEEFSKFYQLKIPASTDKPVSIAVKAPNGGAGMGIVVQSECLRSHSTSLDKMLTMLPSTYVDGAYKAEIPAIATGGLADISLVMGVGCDYAAKIASQSAPSNEQTRAVTTPGGVTYKLRWIGDGGKYEEKVLNDVAPFIDETLPLVESVGFRIPEGTVIPIRLGEAKDWGNFEQHKFVTSWSEVVLSAEKFIKIAKANENDINQLKQTLVHELTHYYTSIAYEPRSALIVKLDGLSGSIWTVLDEATGSWIEKTTGEMLMGFNTKDYADEFLKSFCPPELNETTAKSHGYGMGVFLEFIAKKYGNAVVEQAYRDKKAYMDVIAVTDNGFYMPHNYLVKLFKMTLGKLPSYKVDFFSSEGYGEFVDSVVLGKIDERVSMTTLATKEMTVKETSQTLAEQVYDWGMSARRLKADASIMNLENKRMIIQQLNPDVLTHVFVMEPTEDKTKPFKLVDKIEVPKNKSLEIEAGLADAKISKKYLYVLSTNRQQGKMYPQYNDSKLAVRIIDPDPTLSISGTGTVTFGPEEEEQSLTITSNCSDLDVVSSPTWCSAWINDGILHLKAKKNSENNEREGEVKVKATNSRGSIEAAVKVKQNKTFAGFMEYAGVIVHLSYGSSIQPYPGYLRGRVAYCTPYIDKDGNGIITSSGSYSTTVDGNRYEKWGQRYHTYEEDNVTWDISLTVSLGGDNPKIINGRVYTLAERKVNEDVEWENSNGETFKSSHYTKWVYETSFDISNLDEFILNYSSQRNSSDDDYMVWCNGYRATATSLDKFTTHVRNFKQTMDVTSNNSGFEPKHEEITLPSNASLYSITVGLWKDDHWHEPVGK